MTKISVMVELQGGQHTHDINNIYDLRKKKKTINEYWQQSYSGQKKVMLLLHYRTQNDENIIKVGVDKSFDLQTLL